MAMKLFWVISAALSLGCLLSDGPWLIDAAANECLFENCICDYFNGDESIGLSIVCAYSDISKPRPKNYFPRRLGNDFVINSVRKNVNDVAIKSMTVTAYDFQTIPDGIFANMSMAELHLINNNLETLTTNAFRDVRALKFMDIDDSRFKQIQPGTLTSLNTISGVLLSNCDLSSGRFEALVGELRDVYTLILRNNQLKSFNPEWLAGLKQLTQLSIDSNGLVDFQSKTFKENAKLSILSLVSNELTDMSVVFNALEPISNNIYELNLESNKIGELKEFVNYIRLNRLLMSRNTFQKADKNIFAQLFNLNLLDLSFNQIGSIDSSNFETIKNVRELLLNDNKLTRVPSIKGLVNLKRIDLTNQNGALAEVDGFAFERKTLPNEMLKIELDQNTATQFNTQTFCSHFYTETRVNSLVVSYGSLDRFNKCLLKQLQVGSFLDLVTASSNLVNCNCDLKLFAEKNSVSISGVCDAVFKSLTCDPQTYTDSCLTQPQFVCGYVPTTTTITTSTITVPTTTTTTTTETTSTTTTTTSTSTTSTAPTTTTVTSTTTSIPTTTTVTTPTTTTSSTVPTTTTISTTVSSTTTTQSSTISIITTLFPATTTKSGDTASTTQEGSSTSRFSPIVITSTTSGPSDGCNGGHGGTSGGCSALGGINPLVYVGSALLLASFLSLPYIYRKM